MFRFRSLGVWLVTLIFTVSLPVSMAAEPGWYLGAGIGEATTGLDVSDLDDGSLISGAIDDGDSTWKAYGGYQWKFVAVEAAYLDLGQVTFIGESDGSQAVNDGYGAGPVGAEADTQALFLEVVGSIPIGRVSLFGKAGLSVWAADGGVLDSGIEFDLDDFDLAESGTGAIFGAGIDVRATKRFILRAEWEQATDALLDEDDLQIITLGGRFRF